MRSIILALVAAALGACTPPVKLCETALPEIVVLPMGIEGQELELNVSHVEPCLDDFKVEASVLGPDNAPIDVEVRSTSPRSEGRLRAVLAFTPQVPGSYHVSARFPPSPGLEQLDVRVARDATGAAAVLELDPQQWSSCTHVDMLPSGRPICLAPPSARAADVLWLSDGGEISRWVERDGGLVREPDRALYLDVALVLPAESLAVVFGHDLGILGIAVDAGAFVIGERIPYGSGMPESWTAWRNESRVVIDDSSGCVGQGILDMCMPTFNHTRFLGTDSTGIFGYLVDTLELMHLDDTGTATIPEVISHGPVARSLAEWDTGAMLLSRSGGPTVLMGWDGGFTFTAYGTVTSATSQWVTVDRGDKLVLLHR